MLQPRFAGLLGIFDVQPIQSFRELEGNAPSSPLPPGNDGALPSMLRAKGETIKVLGKIMPRGTASIVIDRNPAEVFDLIHDYDRRLEWDTLLRRAELVGGAATAGTGVRSVCTGKWLVGGMAMETEYVSFEPGKVAAVKLTNRPPFFKNFAATLRHKPITENQCETTYIYNFRAKPRWLAWCLEPIMNAFLAREIKARLRALKTFMEGH